MKLCVRAAVFRRYLIFEETEISPCDGRLGSTWIIARGIVGFWFGRLRAFVWYSGQQPPRGGSRTSGSLSTGAVDSAGHTHICSSSSKLSFGRPARLVNDRLSSSFLFCCIFFSTEQRPGRQSGKVRRGPKDRRPSWRIEKEPDTFLF